MVTFWHLYKMPETIKLSLQSPDEFIDRDQRQILGIDARRDRSDLIGIISVPIVSGIGAERGICLSAGPADQHVHIDL